MATAAALRIVEREAHVFRRLWRGTAFSAFLTPVLFLAAIGLGLGGLVDENRGAVAGLSYLVFVTPGLLVASAMQSAAQDSLWPVMSGTKWQRTYHAMVATPSARPTSSPATWRGSPSAPPSPPWPSWWRRPRSAG